MRKSFALLLSALALTAGTGFAQTVGIETFENLTSLDPDPAPVTGSSTVTDAEFSDDQGSSDFGPPQVTLINDDGTDYPNAADNQYLQWNGSTDQYLALIHTGAGFPNTADTINVAFALRVDTLEATAANNTLDITFVAGGGTFSNLFGLAVDAGTFRMASGNAWGAANVLSTTAFGDAGSTGAWDDGEWRVIICSVTPKTDGTGEARFRAFALSTGAEEFDVSFSGATNTNAATAGLGQFSFGASLADPSGAATAVSLDTLAIYESTLTPEALLAAVKADFGLPANANVDSWDLY
ncbi:MAG: hypothetical protein RLY93_08120 [Sumerlaeia bacterium]